VIPDKKLPDPEIFITFFNTPPPYDLFWIARGILELRKALCNGNRLHSSIPNIANVSKAEQPKDPFYCELNGEER
jgi:hypothetical protein